MTPAVHVDDLTREVGWAGKGYASIAPASLGSPQRRAGMRLTISGLGSSSCGGRNAPRAGPLTEMWGASIAPTITSWRLGQPWRPCRKNDPVPVRRAGQTSRFTSLPSRSVPRRRVKACNRRNGAVRLMARCVSQSSGLVSQSGIPAKKAALFTKPKTGASLNACSARRGTASGLRRSARRIQAPRSMDSISLRVLSARSRDVRY